MTQTTTKPATPKQLRYLRALAQKTGTTFTQPRSSRDASREINRMRALATDRDPREQTPAPAYATAPDASEITGYGVHARWRHTPPSKQKDPGASDEAPPSGRVRARVIAHHEQNGIRRQVITIPAGKHRLLIDRSLQGRDARLLARLDPDEPACNERLIARMYLAEKNPPVCRRLTRADLEPSTPAASNRDLDGLAHATDRRDRHHIPAAHPRQRRRPDAPLERDPPRRHTTARHPRHVVGCLESYQPALEMSNAAIGAHENQVACSAVHLIAELTRLRATPIVLNRLLRERVQQAIERQHITMGEIALRCGHIRHDKQGRPCGETSWLARRIGLQAEAGYQRPTPWVHVDVLATIARDGLGIMPSEVELT